MTFSAGLLWADTFLRHLVLWVGTLDASNSSATKTSEALLFTVGTVRVPATLYEIILPIGFLLLLGHYFLKALAAALELRK